MLPYEDHCQARDENNGECKQVDEFPLSLITKYVITPSIDRIWKW